MCSRKNFDYWEFFHQLEFTQCPSYGLYLRLFAWMLSCFSSVWLFCDSMDYSLAGSSVRGILQARILEWVAMLPDSRIEPLSESSALAGGFFTTGVTWEALDSLSLRCDAWTLQILNFSGLYHWLIKPFSICLYFSLFDNRSCYEML